MFFVCCVLFFLAHLLTSASVIHLLHFKHSADHIEESTFHANSHGAQSSHDNFGISKTTVDVDCSFGLPYFKFRQCSNPPRFLLWQGKDENIHPRIILRRPPGVLEPFCSFCCGINNEKYDICLGLAVI